MKKSIALITLLVILLSTLYTGVGLVILLSTLYTGVGANINGNALWEEEPTVVKNQFLSESARITDVGMAAAREMLAKAFSENITEGDVARHAANTMVATGSSEYVEAFEVIVASGDQSALPHGDSSDDETNKILEGEVVVVDLGARYRGYCTDQTRTFFMGNITEEMEMVYNIVLEAQSAAFLAVRAGVMAADVDKVARDIITANGYGDNFTHGLGHGIGLYIHMPPTLSPSSRGILAQSGDMAISIEPGIYLEGNFGVRIEDDVLVLRSGHELLTHYPKDLENAMIYPEHVINESVGSERVVDIQGGNTDNLIVLGVVVVIAAIIIVIIIKKRKKSADK